jgi:hypothetical protein
MFAIEQINLKKFCSRQLNIAASLFSINIAISHHSTSLSYFGFIYLTYVCDNDSYSRFNWKNLINKKI